MRSIILLLICLLKFSASQGQVEKTKRIEILLIGTSHKAAFKISQDTSGVMRNILSFKPDAIAVEIIPEWDSISLINYRSKFINTNDSILKANRWERKFIIERIKILESNITLQPQQYPLYDSLAFYYMLAGDIYGNSAYNWYIAQILSKSNLFWKSVFSENSFYKWMSDHLKGSEFTAFIFPYALQKGTRYLYPIDDQTESIQAKKYQKKTMNSLLLGILKLNFKGLKVLKLVKRQRKEYTEAENKGNAYDFVNTEKFQLQLAELFDNIYPKWSKSKWAKLLQQNWKRRNERIAERIKAIYQQKKEINKIVVFIGAAHIPALKKIFSKTEGIIINTYN